MAGTVIDLFTAAKDRLLYGPVEHRFENRSTRPSDTRPPINLFMKRAGTLVSHQTALQVAAVFSCVRYIAETIATLPWNVLIRQPDGRKEMTPNNPLWRLLHTRPNPEMSPFAWKETMTAWALTWGNGYAEIERDNAMRPAALWPITPDRVTPKRDRDSGRLFYEVNNGSGAANTILQPADMFHLHGLGFDGITGYSVVNLASRSMGTGLAADEFINSFYGNNTVIGGVLEHPDGVSDKAYKRLQESWEKRHKGGKQAFKPAILEEGMKWQSIGMPLKDAEFLATRRFNVAEICRWFRVPPHKIMDLDRATFNNIEHLAIEAVTDALMPWIIRLEEEANFKLVGDRNQGRIFTKFNASGLLRGDTKTRGEFYQLMHRIGALSPNEIRALEDLNPIGPEGDVHVTQSQYIPLDQLGQQQAPALPPAGGQPDEE